MSAGSSSSQRRVVGKPFVKGQSGNPTGGSKALKAVEEAARVHSTLAIRTLAEICGSKKFASASRVSAAVALLDRGWGKPKQAIEATMSFDLADMMRRGRARAVTIEAPASLPAVSEDERERV